MGVCKMVSEVSFGEKFAQWSQSEKWPGKFKVEWVFVKDIPNKEFKSIIIPNNEYKPVTNSRDTQEVPLAAGKRMLEIFKTYSPASTLFDEFEFYDEQEQKRSEPKDSSESFGRFVHDNPRGQHRRGGRRGGRGPRMGREERDYGRERPQEEEKGREKAPELKMEKEKEKDKETESKKEKEKTEAPAQKKEQVLSAGSTDKTSNTNA